MGLPAGKPKTGGRQKGTPNKRIAFSVHERLKEGGIDLIKDILKDIEEMKNPVDRCKCRLQLLEYCDAKRKAIEMTGDINLDPEREKIRNMPTAELVKLVKENIAEVN